VIVGGKLQPGDVLLHHNFMFDDGNVANAKFLVVFGECAGNEVLFFLATSQEKWGRNKKAQCQPQDTFQSSFYAPARKGQFSKDTWILLEPSRWPSTKLVDRLSTGKCFRAFSLQQQDYQALRNCFRRCPEYAPGLDAFR
jgi:hypothetical protein